jgi:hypothetical protein
VSKAYLSACLLYRDEAPYLREWIEFHRLVGFERFFLYDQESIDDHQSVLAPYLEDGTVVLHTLPFPKGDPLWVQRGCYVQCLEEHREDARWIAFIDIDEFVFSPTYRPVSELLPEYEHWPGVGINWAMFGSSGHLTKPPGLVVENYLYRTDNPDQNRHIKSIVDPTRALSCPSAHFFTYSSGFAVDENKKRLADDHFSESVSFERLRINHYYMKSHEEAARRFDLPTPRRLQPRMFPLRPARFLQRLDRRLNKVRDETILPYLPSLREAIAAREA